MPLFWLHVRNYAKLTRRHLKKKQFLKKIMDQGKHLPFVITSSEGPESLRDENYPDFLHLPHTRFPKDLAQDVAWAFNKLESEGFFYRHWVMVQGKHVLTPVSRTLVGDPGMTYRYLGLRIFALPWSFKEGKVLNEVEQACSIIGRLNQFLRTTSCQVLKSREDQAKGNQAEQLCSKGGSERDRLDDITHDRRISGENPDSTPSLRVNPGACSEDGSKCLQGFEDSREVVTPPCCSALDSADGNANSSHTSCPSTTVSSRSGDSHRVNVSQENEEQAQMRDRSGHDRHSGSEHSEQKHSEPNVVEPTIDNKAITAGLKRSPEGSQEGEVGPQSKKRRPGTRAETVEEGTDFNVALINYMDPEDPDLSLKPEPFYGMGPLAVSWHMDGNLLRGSTVAVYSYTCEGASAESEGARDWMVGIRKPWDDVTPALAAPLASGDAYFMLADLNDTHQHCVIAGDQPRFASTHRAVDVSVACFSFIGFLY